MVPAQEPYSAGSPAQMQSFLFHLINDAGLPCTDIEVT